MKVVQCRSVRARTHSGVSLIITMIMLVIIGLTAAASMRGAVSSEKLVNNLRLEGLAQQFAEAALRYCETEMAKANAARVAALQTANLPAISPVASADWRVSTTWTDGVVPAPISIPAPEYLNGTESTYQVAQVTAPQCYVNPVTLPSGSPSFVITARGFSPGYQANANGTTAAGSVVWLQSMLALN